MFVVGPMKRLIRPDIQGGVVISVYPPVLVCDLIKKPLVTIVLGFVWAFYWNVDVIRLLLA
jgi:hypothetical protein